MIYKVTTDGKEQTYEGFSHRLHTAIDRIAVAWMEDGPEFWAIDSDHAVEELSRYYRSEWKLTPRISIYKLASTTDA